MPSPRFTVGDLRRHLADWPDDMELIFSDDGLDFYRLKDRGANVLQMEFNQTISKDKETGEAKVMAP
jgi:hypothetical protein